MKSLLSLWLPVVACMGLIFYMSSLSSPPAPEDVSDKTLHFAAYFGLALLAVRAAAGGRWSGVTIRALVIGWVIATGYGATDEVHQRFTEGRTPDVADLGADAFGAAVAAGAVGAWSIIRRL